MRCVLHILSQYASTVLEIVENNNRANERRIGKLKALVNKKLQMLLNVAVVVMPYKAKDEEIKCTED